MYSEIAAVLPQPAHEALVLALACALLAGPAFLAHDAFKNRRALRRLEIKMGLRVK